MKGLPVVLLILYLSEASAICSKWYTIKSGDVCYSIFQRENLDEAKLKKLNPSVDCDKLQVGDALCVAESDIKPNCAEWYTIVPGDYCYKIWTDHKLSERQFRDINPELNCDAIEAGKKLCIRGDFISTGVTSGETSGASSSTQQPLTTGSNGSATTSSGNTGSGSPSAAGGGGGKHETLTPRLPCGENYLAMEGDTCDQIATSFSIKKEDIMKLNSFIDCQKPLQEGDQVCVFQNSHCQIRHKIVDGDTCTILKNAFRLTDDQLRDLNDAKFDCNRLQKGQQVCVWSIFWRRVPDMDCEKKYVVKKGDTCWAISTTNAISVDELVFMNPRINCANLQVDDNICVRGKSSSKCAQLVSISAADTCESIAEHAGLSLEQLMNFNPTLNCQHLNRTAQICFGTGYFDAGKCVSTYRIQDTLTTCTNLPEYTHTPIATLKTLNPYLDCNKPINASALICVESLGGFATGDARQKVVSSLEKVAPDVAAAYQNYLNNPSYDNSAKMNQILSDAMLKPEVNKVVKELYDKDEDMRKILQTGETVNGMSRAEICEGMKTLKYTQAVKDCFCNFGELMINCRIRAAKEAAAGLKEQEGDHLVSRPRNKRDIDIPFGGTCKFKFPGSKPAPGKDAKTKGQLALEGYNSCFGGGCTIPMGIWELSLSGDICVGPLKIVGRMIQFCKKNEETCSAVDGGQVQGLQVLIERTASVKLKLCIIGTDMVKKLSQYELGILCWTIAAADYAGFVGRLSVYAEISAVILKIKGGAYFKLHEMPFPGICDHKKFECEDFCLWKFYNSPPGANYGFLKMTAFEIFGFDGFTLFDLKFNNPSKAGCNKGKKAAIIMMNQRKCKDPYQNYVWSRCFSGDDVIKWELLGEERGFDFEPWGQTVFACEFVDMHEQKIGFEVYGDKSNQGLGNYYYAVRNDGVYFSKDKDVFTDKKDSWKNECEPAPEEKEDNDIDGINPTGESSVPASKCGKRIIGYYTGWGEREITEEQLKKVTHVIFAFIATKADGSIGFGAVSNDDKSSDSTKKAEERFKDLRKKVRGINAGVKMMFAVGGWDNSQYFSGIAGNDGKRKRFVDGVADFLKEHSIDGVDVDWEYPVTGGAKEGFSSDKENYVTLLKELKDRLMKLKDETGRKDAYEISLASAAGEWTIRPGYDLSGILKYADFINVMTYDYYGAWESKWGAYTGPPAPLYYGSPKGFSGKLNADFSMKYYACRSKKPSQLNMGVPFYGRFWNNVGAQIDPEDDMWRTADQVGGKFEGGFVGWRNLGKEGWNTGSAKFHDKTKSPYIFDSERRKFLGFENERSLKEKVDYAIKNNLGGLMIWALDQDDDSDTLLKIVSSADLCSGGSGNTVKHKCVPIDDVRWWNPENGGPEKQGMCGKSAPLFNGYYPVCDPDDPGYACCGAAGYCGSGKEFCDCKECVDYRKNPDAILKQPTRPANGVRWYLMDAPDGKRGRCGKGVPLLDGKLPECNPDDPAKHCCSNGGYCGTGKEFCDCDGCIDFLKKTTS